MDPQEVIDLGRDAIRACLVVGGPILLASLIVGMLVGTVQAMTQVPDQSVSFVPKLICLVLALGVALPWLTDRMLDYSRETLATPINLRHYCPTTQPVKFERTARQDQLKPVPNESGDKPTDKKTKPTEIKPSKPPFQLPNFRYSRLPKENISG